MLNVYAWSECPHCHRTIEWLKAHHVPFAYHEVEDQPAAILNRVIRVNGGDDWVVPTLENNGNWRAGEVFNPEKLPEDLRRLGVELPA